MTLTHCDYDPRIRIEEGEPDPLDHCSLHDPRHPDRVVCSDDSRCTGSHGYVVIEYGNESDYCDYWCPTMADAIQTVRDLGREPNHEAVAWCMDRPPRCAYAEEA